MDKNGKETDRNTETWDVIGLEGSAYRKLIQRDDKTLVPKEQKKEDERLAKEIEQRRKGDAGTAPESSSLLLLQRPRRPGSRPPV